MSRNSLPISVCIPTYGRDSVLTDTIKQFLALSKPAAEMLIIDQTPKHDEETEKLLRDWKNSGDINWIRLSKPSQPAALNVAIQTATQDYVLFLDDDINIDDGFVEAHYNAFENNESIWAVAGQVLQPEEVEDPNYIHPKETGLLADVHFRFRSANKCFIQNGMSGNICIRRKRALELGGFDENFSPPVAYRFDNEFCKRLCQAGGKIIFEPKARIYHLRASRGGTRTNSNHLTSMSPEHGVGDYYFALKCAKGLEKWSYIIKRPFREVRTKFHLKNPWYIPVKFLGELRAIFSALSLKKKGPKYISIDSHE